jgi:hypothetical protein
MRRYGSRRIDLKEVDDDLQAMSMSIGQMQVMVQLFE